MVSVKVDTSRDEREREGGSSSSSSLGFAVQIEVIPFLLALKISNNKSSKSNLIKKSIGTSFMTTNIRSRRFHFKSNQVVASITVPEQ
jgi:hypothetical protein